MRVLTSADLDELRDLRARDEFFWLDLDDPDTATADAVGEALGLHELALEDTREFGQRPKVDSYGEELLLVYFGAHLDAEDGPLPVEVHLHISGGFVLTVHRDQCRQFEAVQDALIREPPASEAIIVYRVLDALTDSVLDVVEQVAVEIDDFETEVFKRPRARDRDRMATLRRSLGRMRRVLVIQHQVFQRLVEHLIGLPGLTDDASASADAPAAPAASASASADASASASPGAAASDSASASPGAAAYYRDVGDHLSRAIDEVEASRDGLQGILETYTNEVQERLTIVATIFLPLTVITGFFGQNFNWLISHIGSGWAFWGLGVGGLAVSAAGILLWLRRSGLYQGRR